MAPTSPYFTHGPERSRVDVHDEFSSYAAFHRQSGVDATSAETKVAHLARKEDAVRWEATERCNTTAIESRMTGTIFVGVGALSHINKIVRCARRLENGIKVTRIETGVTEVFLGN
jgi:hypothetical protein